MVTKKIGLLLEAEVAPKQRAKFENKYLEVTGIAVTPGTPESYQSQDNKWGSELRVYFNDKAMAITLEAAGIHVEGPRQGYKSGEYRYRFNNNGLWWKLVSQLGLRLGLN